MKFFKKILLYKLLFLFIFGLFISCSSSNLKVKSDLEIYQEMNSFNSSTQFDKFSDSFVDLLSNHPSSIYLKDAFLIAISSSIRYKEFKLAKFYLSKMKSKFLSYDNGSFYDFYDLKISFMMIKDKNRNQKELIDLKEKSNAFLEKYGDNDYSYMMYDIISSIDSSLYLINKNASNLYDILDNKTSSDIYANKNLRANLKQDDIIEPKSFFIIEIFE